MSKIVEATGASSSSLAPGRKGLSKLIETAMTEAIKKAQAEGITDPNVIKERMLQARQEVKDSIG